MPIYRAGFTGAATPANAAAYATLNSPTRKALVHQIDMVNITTTACQVGFGIPANEATPPVVSTSITPVGRPSDIAATARIGTAWSTAPTAPTVMDDEKFIAGVAGAGYTMKWAPDEYDELKIGGWRTMWNRSGSAAGTMMFTFLYEE